MLVFGQDFEQFFITKQGFLASKILQKNTVLSAMAHCIKGVRIWSYSGPHFSRIQTE